MPSGFSATAKCFQRRFPKPPQDNSWKGDELLQIKPAGTVRMLFQNVRSFHFSKDGNTLSDLVQLQDYLSIDVLGISEHHQDIAQIQKKMELAEIVHRHVPGRAASQFDSSEEQATSGTKPGGTALLTVGPLVGRLNPKGKGGDSLGRWSYMSYRRNEMASLTIIAVYQVCKDPTNVIGGTAWHQQRRALDLQGRKAHP